MDLTDLNYRYHSLYSSRFLQGEMNSTSFLSFDSARYTYGSFRREIDRGASIPKQATSQTAKIKWWQM